ncbi:MAG TPA: response regulator [Anaerolineae bacterium]|nr:response regulator [Anaerolineae bacterium]
MKVTRILLADDHALIRLGIRTILDGQTHLQIVGELEDGRSLLAEIERLQPDLLLLDVTMPHFEPIKAIQQIRALYPDILILVVSAYDDDVYVQGLLRAGVNGYHLKDNSLNELTMAVDWVLKGKRWISSSLVDKLLQPVDKVAADLPKLSSRQIEILSLLAKGLDNRAMAAHLGLSVKTIETHLTRLYRRLKVQSRLEAVNFVHEHPELIAVGVDVAEVGEMKLVGREMTTILVVDDNQRYRQQLRRMIGRVYPQADIYEAGNTEDAVHLVGKLAPQIAFVDVVLGDEDGIRCTRQIKGRLFDCRVILMSAYPDREFHRRGLAAGANAFLDKKDLDSATLYQIVADAVG